VFVKANKKCLTITKTLGYYTTEFITSIKSFLILAQLLLASLPLYFVLVSYQVVFLPIHRLHNAFIGKCWHNGTTHFKKVNNCLKANIYYYLETSGGQSSINVGHFFNTRVN
jgi:hypothetical protein